LKNWPILDFLGFSSYSLKKISPFSFSIDLRIRPVKSSLKIRREKMNDKSLSLIESEKIESKIYSIRGFRVMLDFDLAQLYEVETRSLKQAVKRNITRFPEDFMFNLTKQEWKELITNCDKLPDTLKFNPSTPFAFTEHGILMLSSILRSTKAIEVNIQITRTFVKLRKIASSNEELSRKIKDLEKAVKGNCSDIKLIFNTINTMLKPRTKEKPKIGFNQAKKT